MRGSKQRGGDNKISDILGDSFKDLVKVLRSNDNGKFNLTYAGQSNLPTGAKSNDVNSDVVEALIATANAFRKIENPNIGQRDIAVQYANELYQIYDSFQKNKFPGYQAPANSKFEFEQLPRHDASGLQQLSPGFHYFGYNKHVYEIPTSPSQENALMNAIRYLYHFFAILNLDNVNVREAMLLLRTDNLGFMKYVNEAADVMLTEVHHNPALENLPDSAETYDIFVDGIVNGLTGVANEIVKELKSVRVQPGTPTTGSAEFAKYSAASKAVSEAIAAKDANTDRTQDKALNDAVTAAKGVADAALDAYLTALDVNAAFKTELAKLNARATTDANPSADDLAYSRNALLNPVYSDATKVESKVTKDTVGASFEFGRVQKGGQGRMRMKGGIKNKHQQKTGLPVSFPFLYGPPMTDERFLVTQGTPIVGDASRAAIQAAINILQSNGEYRANFGRNSLATHLAFLAENNVIDIDGNKLVNAIKNANDNYIRLQTQINRIPKEINNPEFRDIFVSGLVSSTAKQFILSNGKIETKPSGQSLKGTQKTNLDNPEIWKFYQDFVSKDTSFYGDFFNLVRLDVTSVSNKFGAAGNVGLTEATLAPANEREKYRLNVKKNIGYSRFDLFGQTGGAGEAEYGDIMLVDLVPDVPSDVDRIWLTPTQSISNSGMDILRQIVRQTYNVPEGENTVTIDGQKIDLDELTRHYAISGFAGSNYDINRYYQELLNGTQNAQGISNIKWKEGEMKLSEHMLRQGTMWERVTDNAGVTSYVLKDSTGKTIDTAPSDNCQFISDSTSECLNAITGCLLSGDDKNKYQTLCNRMINLNFDISPNMTDLKQKIQKINPIAAYAILQKLKFGSFLDKEKSDPVTGFRRYKVQSVGSWLRELQGDKKRCDASTNTSNQSSLPDDCLPLADQLGDLGKTILQFARDDKKKAFFDYLDMLVHWVNANSQILNPEEINPNVSGSVYTGKYPQPKNDYVTYKYVNPYSNVNLRVRGLVCDLDRLKQNILGKISGANADNTIASILNTPHNIQMPFNPQAFITGTPFGNFVQPMMVGGGIEETQRSLDRMHGGGDDGYNNGQRMFTGIYKELSDAIVNLPGRRRMELSQNTRNEIDNKLKSFGDAEEAFVKSVQEFIEQNKIYQASRGHVNSFTDDKSKYDAIYEKHKNLLRLSDNYNKRAVNLAEVFTTISNVILDKLNSDGSRTSSKSEYERPMTTGYHYDKKN